MDKKYPFPERQQRAPGSTLVKFIHIFIDIGSHNASRDYIKAQWHKDCSITISISMLILSGVKISGGVK